VNATGKLVDSAEIFDPETEEFAVLAHTGLTTRAYHSATLLTNGQVFIAGGIPKQRKALRTADSSAMKAQTWRRSPTWDRWSRANTMYSTGSPGRQTR
jgi:hypothetical protein